MNDILVGLSQDQNSQLKQLIKTKRVPLMNQQNQGNGMANGDGMEGEARTILKARRKFQK
jgi:hypothetical protein